MSIPFVDVSSVVELLLLLVEALVVLEADVVGGNIVVALAVGTGTMD